MKIRKNGKTITLSESDMRRITKIVMKEQMENDDCLKNLQSKVKDLPPSCLASDTQMLCYTELLQKNTSAAKEFAAQKRLPLKTFLTIWAIGKKKVF
jgi:hypothetical protein